MVRFCLFWEVILFGNSSLHNQTELTPQMGKSLGCQSFLLFSFLSFSSSSFGQTHILLYSLAPLFILTLFTPEFFIHLCYLFSNRIRAHAVPSLAAQIIYSHCHFSALTHPHPHSLNLYFLRLHQSYCVCRHSEALLQNPLLCNPGSGR